LLQLAGPEAGPIVFQILLRLAPRSNAPLVPPNTARLPANKYLLVVS
jgi:hypothetical protein